MEGQEGQGGEEGGRGARSTSAGQGEEGQEGQGGSQSAVALEQPHLRHHAGGRPRRRGAGHSLQVNDDQVTSTLNELSSERSHLRDRFGSWAVSFAVWSRLPGRACTRAPRGCTRGFYVHTAHGSRLHRGRRQFSCARWIYIYIRLYKCGSATACAACSRVPCSLFTCLTCQRSRDLTVTV